MVKKRYGNEWCHLIIITRSTYLERCKRNVQPSDGVVDALRRGAGGSQLVFQLSMVEREEFDREISQTHSRAGHFTFVVECVVRIAHYSEKRDHTVRTNKTTSE